MTKLVAIHQPNFFPWLGYFDKIRRADVFVFLDAVDYPRSGSGGMGSWTNRVKLAIQGQERWFTCPVRRMPLGASICDAEIDDQQPWRSKLLKTLQANYAKAPRFRLAIAEVEALLESPERRLADFNVRVVKAIAEQLELSTQFVRQSELGTERHSTDLLLEIVRSVHGTAYLAGGGAGGYQRDNVFAEHGIDLVYQSFKAFPYGDPEKFLPGLSVIDYLMRDGRPLRQSSCS